MADEIDPRLVEAILGQAPKAPWRGPGERPAPGPNEPDTMPAWYREVQPYPVNIPAAIEGGLAVSGMSAGPAGAITSGAKAIAESPLARSLGAGGAAFLGLTTPTVANKNEAPAAQSVAPRADEIQSMLDQRKLLADQAEAARRTREEARARQRKEMPPNGSEPDPKKYPLYARAKDEFTKAESEFNALNGKLTELDGQIAHARKLSDPAYLENLRIEEENRQQALKDKRAATPTRELMSDYTWAIPAATYTATLLGGAALKARGMSGMHNELNNISDRWKTAVDAAKGAKPNSREYTMAAQEAKGLEESYGKALANKEHGSRHALELGGGLGVAGAFLPEEIDFARAAVGSPLWDSLKSSLIDDWPSTLKRAGIGAGLGMLTGHVGSLGPQAYYGQPRYPTYGAETAAVQPKPPRGGGPAAPPTNTPSPTSPAGPSQELIEQLNQALQQLPKQKSPSGGQSSLNEALQGVSTADLTRRIEDEAKNLGKSGHWERQPRNKKGRFDGPPE